VKTIKTGDRCPLCGQIVTTEDPEKLAELTAWAQLMERLGVPLAGEEDCAEDPGE